ncbi:NCS1 family nucleobase:cation symporter-1 [Marinibactrum halimedae]|uniref:Nitrate reductase n=1 Tax=Marinibactrum halimedae TaxID=1444977 RepID=A0AA37T5B8_9GAMM|nr:NCS1 family nucleobase:cation symporter-1 [Marinibactrum halimedae]MCD9457967.1 NCS1 family nucleobase:cation symporter-1 [Marinibactrum halimedae]GLS27593.1 nitrate reductase [Marinibactrum halimedae]
MHQNRNPSSGSHSDSSNHNSNYSSNYSSNYDTDLWNEDLAPTTLEQRNWNWFHYASLWVAMVVCVPTYMIAAGLVSEGMNWWQAIATVLLGNMIVLVPMVMIGHAGAKHGLPFPVLLRSAFGTKGARIPAVARGLVACGWFGIQTWVGGSAIYVILNALTGNTFHGTTLPFLGIDIAQTLCFFAFWLIHIFFIRSGTQSIRWLESYCAPFLILMGLALLFWAYQKAGGFGEMLSAPSQFGEGAPKEGKFLSVFFSSLTAMVGFWATVALNIPDFTRFAKSQKDQILGQAVGLPLPMALFAFIGVAVTSATVTIYGEAIWDPVVLTSKMGGISVVIALFALALSTLTTNLAANVVAPAYGFSNLNPSKISFKMGGYITAGIGLAMFPWKLLESSGGFIFTWLIGYSALLGPIAGILMADYFIVKKCDLEIDALFRHDGQYGANNGWNWNGIIAFIAGVLPNLPGFFHTAGFIKNVPIIFDILYQYAWFTGLFIAGALYLLMTKFSQNTSMASNQHLFEAEKG